MPLDLPAPGPRGSADKEKRRSLIGRMFRGIGWVLAGPVDWVGLRVLSRGASLIRILSNGLGSGSRRDPRFRTSEDRSFDLEATVFLRGISVFELKERLVVRRRQTAQIAYMTFVLGCLSLLAWVREAMLSVWTAGRVVLAVEFLPFCALFFLVAFYNALLNFQIRTGRTASWREYLATSEPFWPR
jgi:hypothetical protein